MSQYGELIAPDTVQFKRRLPGTSDRVWSYLVEGDKRARWLAGGDTEERVGGHVDLKFHNGILSALPDDPPPEKYKDMPEQISYTGKVTQCEPKTLLAHTWVGDDGEESEVTYELEQRDDGVMLTVTHRRIIGRDMLTGVCGGWHTHLDILADILEEKEPQPFWRTHTALEVEYSSRLP